MPPEVWNNEFGKVRAYTKRVDWYDLGLLIAFMYAAAGSFLFFSVQEEEVYADFDARHQDTKILLKEQFNRLNVYLFYVVRQLLSEDPEERFDGSFICANIQTETKPGLASEVDAR